MEDPRLFIHITHSLCFSFVNSKQTKIIFWNQKFLDTTCFFEFNLRKQHCDTDNCGCFPVSSGRGTAGRPATDLVTRHSDHRHKGFSKVSYSPGGRGIAVNGTKHAKNVHSWWTALSAGVWHTASDPESHSISKDEGLWYLVTLWVFFKQPSFSHQYSIILCSERALRVEMAPVVFLTMNMIQMLARFPSPLLRSLWEAFYFCEIRDIPPKYTFKV